MERFWEPKTNVFSFQNRSSALWARKWSIFGWNFSIFIFGTASTRKWSPIFDQHRDRNWRLDLESSWVSTHRARQQALRYAENSSSTKAASICQASNKTCAACCALLPTPARLRHHHEPLGRGCCDCVDYESSCDVAQPQTMFASSRTRRVVAVWEIASCWWTRSTQPARGKDDT